MPEAQTPNILIVEDEEFVCDIMQRILKRSIDCNVATCGDGNDALAMIRKENFDLIILDLRLPGLSGFEIIRLMKESNSIVPVLVITGSENKTLTDQLEEQGVGYLPKPIVPEVFIDKVKTILQ